MMKAVPGATRDEESEPSPAAAARSPHELGAIYARDYRRLVGLARLLVDTTEEAEELVQEAFARTYANWSRLHNERSAAGYVQRTVLNLARGSLRSRRSARRRRPPEPEAVPMPDEVYFRSQDHRQLTLIIRGLPNRQRECVALRYYLDLSTEQTAAALGISTGSVKTHLHRALQSIESTWKERT